MRHPEASAVPTTQQYTFESDEAEFRIPPELLAEMVNWCGQAREWQTSIWCRISSGDSSLWRSARFFASDGCRMLRADFPTSMPEGTYRVSADLDQLILVGDDWPREIEHAKLWDRFPPKGPWSINPEYFADLARIEKALKKAHLRESPPKGSMKEKQRQREVVNGMFISWFELGGQMDAMVIRFGSTTVQALIMPRRM